MAETGVAQVGGAVVQPVGEAKAGGDPAYGGRCTLHTPGGLLLARSNSPVDLHLLQIPNFLVRVAMKAAEQHRQEGLQGPQTEDGVSSYVAGNEQQAGGLAVHHAQGLHMAQSCLRGNLHRRHASFCVFCHARDVCSNGLFTMSFPLQYDVASALTAVLDELDALGSEGARRVEVGGDVASQLLRELS